MTTTRADRAARIARETKFITASEDYDYPPRVDRLIQDAADLIAEYAAAESADDLAITGRFTTVEELNKHLRAERAAVEAPVAPPTVAGYSGDTDIHDKPVASPPVPTDLKTDPALLTKLKAAASPPAPSAEPVAWLPDEGAYIIRFDDADREDELFAMAGAREAAMKRYAQISGSWNAHLFVKINSNSRDVSVPSAIPPAPAPESEAIAILRELIRTEDWRPARAYLATLAQSQAQGEPEKREMNELRITWEMLDPQICSELHGRYGDGYWLRVKNKEQYASTWSSSASRIFQEGDAMHMRQYEQLKAWEKSQKEPIRNVRLEKRTTEKWGEAQGEGGDATGGKV